MTTTLTLTFHSLSLLSLLFFHLSLCCCLSCWLLIFFFQSMNMPNLYQNKRYFQKQLFPKNEPICKHNKIHIITLQSINPHQILTMNEMIFNKMGTQGELILDEEILEMPIKKSKQLQNMIKHKVEEKKHIEHGSSRFRDAKRPLPLPKQFTNNITAKPLKAITSFQKDLKMTQPQSQYLVSCVIRALQYRKLAIDDIADIFGIPSETIQQIDKFRRIQQLEEDNLIGEHNYGLGGGDKVRKMKMKFKKYGLGGVGGFSSYDVRPSSLSRKSLHQQHPPQFYTSTHNTLSSYQLSSIMQSAQQRQLRDENLFEYQKLLRCKPPHRLDEKVRAIIEILKKHPNVMQKEIITILAKDYNITNMTQTSISRYYKKIYEMRKHCQVLLQAKQDGFIDI